MGAVWLAWVSLILLEDEDEDEDETAPSCCACCRCFSPRPRRRDGGGAAATTTWGAPRLTRVVDAITGRELADADDTGYFTQVC